MGNNIVMGRESVLGIDPQKLFFTKIIGVIISVTKYYKNNNYKTQIKLYTLVKLKLVFLFEGLNVYFQTV